MKTWQTIPPTFILWTLLWYLAISMLSVSSLDTNLVLYWESPWYFWSTRFVLSLIVIHHLICLLLLFFLIFKLTFHLLEFQLPFSILSWGSCGVILLFMLQTHPMELCSDFEETTLFRDAELTVWFPPHPHTILPTLTDINHASSTVSHAKEYKKMISVPWSL